MKKILVPTDFSQFADNALAVATEIAQKADAEIVLLNVMLTPADSKVTASEKGIFIEGSKTDYLHDSVKGTLHNLEELIEDIEYSNIRPLVTSGKITQSILRIAEEEKVNLIAIGTQGEGTSEDAFFVGSNAEKLVRLADCPVMTIRHKIKETGVKKIAYAINFDDEQEAIITELKKLQKIFEAELHVVYVNCPANFRTTDSLNKEFENLGKKYSLEKVYYHIYCDFVEGDGILHFSDMLQADLIAMATHQRSGFARLFGGSVSEDVVHTAHIPVMTFSIS